MASYSDDYLKTIHRSIQMLMNKQYSGNEYILDDDVIVLTCVDIRSTNDPSETDDSDDDSQNEIAQFYRDEEELSFNLFRDYDYDDMDDFIDDTPEGALSGTDDEKDVSGNSDEEDREYDSESNDGNEDESESENDSESENSTESENNDDNQSENDEIDENDQNIKNCEENERKPRKKRKSNQFRGEHSSESSDDDRITISCQKKITIKNSRQSLSDSSDDENESQSENANKVKTKSKIQENNDSDDEDIRSPRKKFKINHFKEDSSSESSNDDCAEEDDNRFSDLSKKRHVIDLRDSSSSGSDNNSSEDDDDDLTNANRSFASSLPIKNGNYNRNNLQPWQKTHVNKYLVALLPKIHGKLTCLRYHGRIGMRGIEGFCGEMTRKKFCDYIRRKREIYGFTRLNLMSINARTLEYRKESNLDKPVRKLLIHLIDQWFPLGIPQKRHLDRAIDLLNCIKNKIITGKVPELKHSNKFYAMIPHQGDNRRRQRFKDVEYCDSKIEYVNKMISAVEYLEDIKNKRINPLDDFMKNWLQIELKVLESNEPTYEILNEVVEKTQHAKSLRRFHIANIFKVDNMNSNANDFSTNITHNHRYLFHFSFASNLLNILREGLISAPNYSHSNNRFLGKGIYFWDSVANAGLNYKSLNTVYVLVCRVALGNAKQVEQLYLKHDQTFSWDDDIDSIFCLGEKFSSSRDAEMELNGAKIYSGQLDERQPNDYGYSLYTEYVVRNKNQVHVEYIIKLERNANRIQ